jgi:hypothetical protein
MEYDNNHFIIVTRAYSLQKWFYIKDWKVSSSDQYDIALLMPPKK